MSAQILAGCWPPRPPVTYREAIEIEPGLLLEAKVEAGHLAIMVHDQQGEVHSDVVNLETRKSMLSLFLQREIEQRVAWENSLIYAEPVCRPKRKEENSQPPQIETRKWWQLWRRG